MVVLGAALLASSLAVGCGGGNSPATGAGGDSGGSGGAGGAAPSMFTIAVNAAANAVTLDGCGVTPGVLANVPAGTYSLTLTASTLTKGGVSGPTPPPPSIDNYVIVHVPLAAGDAHEDHRFFMLNGVGASATVTLAAMGTIQVMFVDSDTADNAGTATVTLSPGGMTATVSATANLISYDTACHSMPAMQVVPDGNWRLTLLDSTFSSGAGAHDDFVLVRTPSEQPTQDDRYVILNGVGATHNFTPFNSQTVRLWYIGASAGTGLAHVQVTRL
jgi:hypothetical protein